MNEPLKVDDMFVDSTVLELKGANEQLYRVVDDHNAVIRHRNAAHDELMESHFEAMTLLVLASDFRNGRNGLRLLRIGITSELLAKLAGMPVDYCAMIRRAAPLYDIGTTGMPDDLLRKSGELTDDEWYQWKSHTEIGARILSGTSDTPLMCLAAEISLTHHENYQGHGYPSGLVGQAIPLSGRIVALAEYLESHANSVGARRSVAPLEFVVSTIHDLSGRRFDPNLVNLLIANLQAITEAHSRIDAKAVSFQEIAASACSTGSTAICPTRITVRKLDEVAKEEAIREQLYRYAEDLQELLDCRDSLSHVVQSMINSKWKGEETSALTTKPSSIKSIFKSNETS